MKSFHIKLIPPRESFPYDMTEEEQALMSRHAEFLKRLIARKIVFLAGPHLEPTYGMVLLRAESRERALEIIADDPTVRAGLMKVEISPFLAPEQLREHFVPHSRYVTKPTDRVLHKEITVNATSEEVFKAWTTAEGLNSFFGADCNVELRLGGPFEIFFAPAEAAPNRGSEDCHILSFLPNRMLGFEWNAPPSFGELRYTYTQVVIFFDDIAAGCRLTLNHTGWGRGSDWDRLYEYFDSAWDSVLRNLAERPDSGSDSSESCC